MTIISAPGKLMLFGEHAVVYGNPCIVTAVSERLTVCLEKTNDQKITIDAPGVKDTRFVEFAITNWGKQFHIEHQGLHISTKSNFSNCYGFGSSAAVTVATLQALCVEFQQKISAHELFNIAYKTILEIQGVGSGFDVAASVYGGIIEYVKGGSVIEPIRIQDKHIVFIVGYSGVKANTVQIVTDIAKKREQYKERVDRIFSAIADIVEKAKTALFTGDWETVGKYMNFNQEYLRDLGVSTEKLEALIAGAKKAGAYGAKLSGAGGGDCMIAIAPMEKKDAVERAITEAGGEVVNVMWNEEGVRED